MNTELVYDRWEYIKPLVAGKTVLDVGCASEMSKFKSGFMHGKIRDCAHETVGVDINKTQVMFLRNQGYDIILGNAETVKLGRLFDVIVAGELIEHLSNPGLFLDNMRHHLKADGKLIITTPNRTPIHLYLQILRRNKGQDYTKNIPRHVLYFDKSSLFALAERHSFKVSSFAYWTLRAHKWHGKLFWNNIIRKRHDLASYMIAVLEKADEKY